MNRRTVLLAVSGAVLALGTLAINLTGAANQPPMPFLAQSGPIPLCQPTDKTCPVQGPPAQAQPAKPSAHRPLHKQ